MNSANSPAVVVAPVRYALPPLANLVTGYTVKAMQRKIEPGRLGARKTWRRSPDITIDIQEHQPWVESQ